MFSIVVSRCDLGIGIGISVRVSIRISIGGRTPQPTAKRPAAAKAASPSSANVPFHKGDLVEHTAFGRGMIVSLKPMGGDALLEVAFDSVGTKKLMLKAASQHMKKA